MSVLLNWKRIFITILAIMIGGVVAVALYTAIHLRAVPKSFQAVISDNHFKQIMDRNGVPLNITYRNRWNIHNTVPLHHVPQFLKQGFIIAEDKRFYHHSGVDWLARSAAVLANLKALRGLRGASTISEQTIRMLHTRPRTVLSRWLEGFEAIALEKKISKDAILEFYLNQVPYAAQRRGIVQAAWYYFNRDLHTLSQKEMLALVVLVRAPGRLNLWHNIKKIEAGIKNLAERLVAQNILSKKQKTRILIEPFILQSPMLSVNASEFIRQVKKQPQINHAESPYVHTTLDAGLQRQVQTMLDARLSRLVHRRVYNGAILVVDHTSGEILAWVVAGKTIQNTPARFIDAVMTPRQPGSALKPLLYALALEKGWSAATIIDDSPLVEFVGNGLHSYRNYSRRFYGAVTLRQALGNSLNIPALKTLQFVGAKNYFNFLHNFGFNNLNKHPNFYGDGIALGNGEVSLYQLVRAYAAIANGGIWGELQFLRNGVRLSPLRRVLSPEVSSLIGHILSDTQARELEFGTNSILNFPLQTAVKTGTSSDYRDSWALGFNYRYAIGVWMGNLNQRPTDTVSGSTAPALLLRSVFATLNRHQATKPLSLHRRLVKHDLCTADEPNKSICKIYNEWFVPGTNLLDNQQTVEVKTPIRLRQPVSGLHIAYDPRVPQKNQAFEFYIQGLSSDATVVWDINGKTVVSRGGRYFWSIRRGNYILAARVWQGEQQIAEIRKVAFQVK